LCDDILHLAFIVLLLSCLYICVYKFCILFILFYFLMTALQLDGL